jgi:outer membrane protein OmpA-like peptidoglycan-associated protein
VKLNGKRGYRQEVVRYSATAPGEKTMKIYQSMLRRLALAGFMATLVGTASCAGHSTNANSNANAPHGKTAQDPANSETPSKESIADQQTPSREPSLISLSAGAFPVKTPPESGMYPNRTVMELLDERAKSDWWRSVSSNTEPQIFVLALPEKTLLKTVEFDCAEDLFSREGACAKDVSVEVSDANENSGYQTIADVSLKEGADNQKFPVSAEVAGRWVRLTLKNNHGSKDQFQLNDFRATGTQLTHTSFPEVSGTYEGGRMGELHLRHEGVSVSGCFSILGGPNNFIEGGIEGRLVKLNFCKYCSDKDKVSYNGVLVFSPDGQAFRGLYWQEGVFTDYGGTHWDGKKTRSDVGDCGEKRSGFEATLTKDLEEFGRARIYGINFDTDSDTIKDESKPTLDKIAATLKAKPDWKITIEGHTDSTSTPQHNQQLSERRAVSVKAYLQTAGIDPTRLKTIGYGATKPVASNDTELGRAQNRRVEMAKQ